jgi:S1-C subfamily serine protease
LDGKSYSETERLIYRIGDKAPGVTALFEIDRFGEPLVIGPVIGARGEEDAVRALHGSARPGFVAAPLVPDLRVTMNLPEDISGVPVAEVYPRTPAQAVDLRPGDIITAIDGKPIATMKDLYLSLGLSQAEIPEYTVFRNGESIILDTKTGDGP